MRHMIQLKGGMLFEKLHLNKDIQIDIEYLLVPFCDDYDDFEEDNDIIKLKTKSGVLYILTKEIAERYIDKKYIMGCKLNKDANIIDIINISNSVTYEYIRNKYGRSIDLYNFCKD